MSRWKAILMPGYVPPVKPDKAVAPISSTSRAGMITLEESAFGFSGIDRRLYPGHIGVYYGYNARANYPTIEVHHRNLITPEGEASFFRKACPVCNLGTLLVSRDHVFAVAPNDRCIRCGQRYYYLDHETLGRRSQ